MLAGWGIGTAVALGLAVLSRLTQLESEALTLPLQSPSTLAKQVARVSLPPVTLRQMLTVALLGVLAVTRTTTSATDQTQGGLVVALHPVLSAGEGAGCNGQREES